MPALKHPEVDAPKIKAWLPSEDGTIQKMVSAVKEGGGSLNMLLLSTITTTNYRVALNDAEEQVCEALRLGSQAAAAIFQRAAQSTGDVEVGLGPNPKVKLKATGPTGEAHVGNWLKGFFLAAICRDEESLDLLRYRGLSGDGSRREPHHPKALIFAFFSCYGYSLKRPLRRTSAMRSAL